MVIGASVNEQGWGWDMQVPGERYQYRIGSHLPLRSFRAAAKPAPDAGFTFIVYGDMGESDHRAAKSPG